MNLKWLPYFVIAIFTTLVTLVRYFLIPEWSVGIHLLIFLAQFLLLTLIWKLIEWLNNLLDKWIPFYVSIGGRILAQILICICIVGPVFMTIIFFARGYMPAYATPQFLALLGLIFTIFIALINFIFYFKYFFEKWQGSVISNAELLVKAAELEKEKFTMQYHHLRNQVNPHFLFNTLSSLDGLIHTDPELASDFLRHLSKVYRYVLEHKEDEIVSLQTETRFIQHYISLLNIRYGEALRISLKISEWGLGRSIPMVTLQMLIDNAIKHNSVSAEDPLEILIWDEGNHLYVRNNKRPRKQIENSNKQGLKQLVQLFSYLGKDKVEIINQYDYFEVKLPLL